jgi:hypothetical protein
MPKRVTGQSRSTSRDTRKGGGQVFSARVSEIILDNVTLPKEFNRLGEWSSIGIIFFTRIKSPNQNPDPTKNEIAKPLFPNTKHYPLINEIVYIMALPNSDNAQSPNNTSFYYFNPINIWGSNHHNGIPNPFQSTLPESQKRDYKQTGAGAVRRVTDGGTEINLGNTFQEDPTLQTLLPYEGDIIYEGRFGQSFRYGSTVSNATIPNPWSKAGTNGDPILIIKNGQHDNGKDPWVPQIEDINKDLSSIYITSTQQIPIDTPSTSSEGYYTSFPSLNPPTSPNQFVGEQIILTSGRLLLNAKNDSILLSSANSIKLNSIKSVVIESPVTVIQSKEIYFGNKASEPLILGDKFISAMDRLLDQIINLSTSLTSPIGNGSGDGLNAEIQGPASNLAAEAINMKTNLESFKSTITKTK